MKEYENDQVALQSRIQSFTFLTIFIK